MVLVNIVADVLNWYRVTNMERLVVILVIFPGVWSGSWRVTTQSHCFLRSTSAVIPCSYDYPFYHTVRSARWFKYVGSFRAYLKSYPFEFIGDLSHNCSLRIYYVRYEHRGYYYFRFSTYSENWQSPEPAYITVEDVAASVHPPTVTEGDVVTLTCRSGCTTQIIDRSVWFRGGQPVRRLQFKASKEDSGRYTCALPGHEHAQSAEVSLNVQYAPKNVELFLDPSEDIILGSRLTLSCRCDANPPVADTGYSLFKDGLWIGHRSLTIMEVQLSDRGLYSCEAGNNITSNGSRTFESSKADVDVQYPPMSVSISVDSAEAPAGGSVNLICHSEANPPPSGYTWYRIRPASPSEVAGSGPVLTLTPAETSQAGQYMCQTWNKHGLSNSTEVLLPVKSNSISAVHILGALGAFLLVALALALLLFWKWQKRRSCKTTQAEDRDASSPEADGTVEHIYANTPRFQMRPTEDGSNNPNPEEVIYTEVVIKPKTASHIQSTALTREHSVIYSAVTKSS